MQADYNVIGDILAKYPGLTQGEEEQLNKWRSAGENEAVFQELINSENRQKMLERYYEIMEKEGSYLAKVNSLIEEPGSVQNMGRVQKLNNRWMYIAAASVLIVVAAYLFVVRKQTSNTGNERMPVAAANDISPGKYKAKLTLADGSIVYLDSSAKQVINQGSIAVKNTNGQLVYEDKNTSPAGVKTNVIYNTLSTSKGETYGTILSDGSKVWLNSGSSIRYPVVFDGDVRKVAITGEAYFEVAPSPAVLANGKKGKRSFVVDLPGMEVEVLGTHFNINSYTDEETTTTTLLEGKVRVRSTANAAETILQPNEQALMNKQSNDLKKVTGVDVESEVAWRFGLFQFNNADLKTVMRQVDRWYDVQTVYVGDVPKREFLGKIPRNLTLSQTLKVLEMLKVHFKIEGKKIIVSP